MPKERLIVPLDTTLRKYIFSRPTKAKIHPIINELCDWRSPCSFVVSAQSIEYRLGGWRGADPLYR
jgi:hypothetical protein